MVCASVAMVRPFRFWREAAARGVVRVNGLDLGVGEQLPDARVGLTGLGEDRVGHHPVLVEAAQRQDPRLEHRRHLVHIFAGLERAFGDEDGVASTIRVRDIMADVVHQKHALANVAVREADAAGKLGFSQRSSERRRVSQAPRPKGRKRAIWCGVEPCDLVSHGAVVQPANISRFLCLAIKLRHAPR